MILAAAAAAPATGWLQFAVPVLIALFGGGGFVAWQRLRKESPNIVVQAAQGAVIVQTDVLKTLQEELEYAKSEIASLRAELRSASHLQRRVRELEQREEELGAQNTRLRSQVADLQKRVNELERPLTP